MGKSTLYITQFPGYSSLYPPSESYRERYVGNSELVEVLDRESKYREFLQQDEMSTAIRLRM